MAIVSGWDRGTWNQGAWNTEIPVEITGVSAAASAGSVTYQYTITIEGVSASATVGHPMIWTVIDPSQLARWGDISTTQTPTWTEIAA